MIALKYSLTREDYVNYYTYVLWDSPQNRKKRLRYYLRQLIPILIFLLAFYYTGLFDRNGKFIWLIAGFLVLTSLLSLIGVRSNTSRQAEKIAADPNNSTFFLETQLLVSDAGITLKDEVSEHQLSWKAFIKKQDSKQYYFLFTSGIQAIIIPKRIFSVNERQQFDKLLSQQLSFDAELGHLVKS